MAFLFHHEPGSKKSGDKIKELWNKNDGLVVKALDFQS